MASPAKKPPLSVVIGMMGKPKPKDHEMEEAEEMKDEDGDDKAHEDAMSELTEAQSKGDMGRAVEAFRVLYDLCASDHGEPDGDEEEEGY